MATPHVSGAVVLYKAQNSNANAAEIKATILNTGTATASLDGKVLSGKRLNLAGFLTPSAPTTSSPSKAPTPPTPPPTKAPSSPSPPPTANCRNYGQQCKKSTNCGMFTGCAGTGTSCCCCPGLVCGGSGTCR